MKFAREAWPFFLPFPLLGGTLAWLGLPGWALVSALLGVLVLVFFRDPARSFDGGPRTVVAPADGLVTRVDMIEDHDVGPGRFYRIVTFLSIFDVHLQRVPVAGRVAISRRSRGRKVAAFLGHADEVNESHLTVVASSSGEVFGIRQIAGMVARRVVSYLSEGSQVERGQHLGIIKFGSRVDLLIPESYRVLVRKGDRVAGGKTAVAEPRRST